MKLKAVILAAVLAIALTGTSTPASAESKGPAGDTDTSVEIPASYEQAVLEATQAAASSGPQQPNLNSQALMSICFIGFGNCGYAKPDTGYLDCSGIPGLLIREIGVTWDHKQGYDAIHVVPTTAGRLYEVPGIKESLALYAAMHSCLNANKLTVTVSSWTGIYHQLHCHLLGNALFGGASWDLEGHRAANWNPLSWIWNGCNW